MVKMVTGSFHTAPWETLCHLTCMLPMEQCMEKLTHTSALRLFRLPRSSQLLRCLGPDWYEPHHGDFHLVVPQTSSQHGGNKQHPTVLEALALQVPAHGPKVNLMVIAPWEIPVWAAQTSHWGVTNPAARKEWVQSLVEIGLNSSTSVFFTAAKVTWRDVGDLTEVGGTSVVSLWGGEELHLLKWMVGSEVTQFNTNCFTLAKAAECLAKTYSAELDCPPVVYVFSSDNLALQAICNPRSIKAHSSCIHFHKALTTFFLSYRDIRLVLAWSPKNDDLALDLTTRNCAAEACLEFPPQGMDSIQLAAYQKSHARTKAFSEWEHKYLQDHLADSACTGWLGAELAPPRFACTHTLVKSPSIHNHPLWREATKCMTDNGGKKLKQPLYTCHTMSTAFQLAVDHPFTGSYAAHFWPSDPPHTHSHLCRAPLWDPDHIICQCPIFHQQRVDLVIHTAYHTLTL